MSFEVEMFGNMCLSLGTQNSEPCKEVKTEIRG